MKLSTCRGCKYATIKEEGVTIFCEVKKKVTFLMDVCPLAPLIKPVKKEIPCDRETTSRNTFGTYDND